MSVMIHDLEVIAQPPPAGAAAEERAEEPAPPATLRPEDVHEILRRLAARQARLRAH